MTIIQHLTAAILLRDAHGTELSAVKRFHVTPDEFKPRVKLAWKRARASAAREAGSFLACLIGATGAREAGSFTICAGHGALDRPHGYRYEFTTEKVRGPLRIRVTKIDAYHQTEEELYFGELPGWLISSPLRSQDAIEQDYQRKLRRQLRQISKRAEQTLDREEQKTRREKALARLRRGERVDRRELYEPIPKHLRPDLREVRRAKRKEKE